ncbi:MAG: hypothetical protein KJ905_03000 [Nanoarchaeota archaeon]|nr:hypothetical protein [Nanoarchaeota archaeon]MBU2458768.1 hypothetical protein [Nanoarchaeota archaeon]
MNYKNQNQEIRKFIPMKILNVNEKKKIEEDLVERFGIKEIPGELIMRGKERLFFFSGDLSVNKLKKIESKIIVERVGIYFGKVSEWGVRLSIEGVNFLKEQITKNIFDLTESQVEDWIRGRDLDVETGQRGFLVMKYKEDFLGCGKASEKKIGNFIPKSRRVRERS